MKNRTQTWHRIVAKNPILQVSDIPFTQWLTFPCPIKSPLVYYLYGPFQKRARGISYEIIIVKRFRSTLWLTFTEENNEVAEKEFFWKLTTTRFLSAYKTNFHEWVFVIFHETGFHDISFFIFSRNEFFFLAKPVFMKRVLTNRV